MAMREFKKMFENLWIAVAFAEAGEQETAKTFLDSEVCDSEVAEICQTM